MKRNVIKINDTLKYLKDSNKTYFPITRDKNIFRRSTENGKTLSAVRYIKYLLETYPDIVFISNVIIKGYENRTLFFSNTDELIDLLLHIDLNKKGYLIFIDEIHVVLSEIFGKTDPIFLTFLSQQRKLSIHIVGTLQLFSRLPKFFREYIIESGSVVVCNNYFKILQVNKIVDMDNVKCDSGNQLIYTKAKIEWFFHSRELYESYDTYAVITQIQGLMKGSYENGTRLLNDYGTTTEQ